MTRIAVLGAGIVGMSQACLLQEKFPKAEVTLIAEQFSPDVTSDVAAGWWHPYLAGENKEEDMKRWCQATYDYILKFARTHPNHGAMESSGYQFNTVREERPYFADIVGNFRELSEKEIREISSQPAVQGYFFTTLALECSIHLPYLLKVFKSRGGQVLKKRLNSIDDIGSSFDVVVNCTGLGARKLFGDLTIYPTRGQVIRVRCPKVKHFYNEDLNYVLLNSDCIILGGTAEANDWDLTVRPETAKKILEENAKRVPALKDAEILSHHVGLRPTRSTVRIETEYRTIGGKKIPIVHNYGHGGSGVTIFQGCAIDAAKLVERELAVKSKL